MKKTLTILLALLIFGAQQGVASEKREENKRNTSNKLNRQERAELQRQYEAAANYAMNRQRGIKIYMQDDLVLFSIEQYVSSWDYFRDNFNRYIMTFFSAAQDFTNYHNL